MPKPCFKAIAEKLCTAPLGTVANDGEIQRYIHFLHDDFADDDRIDGDYVLLELPVDGVPDSEWEIYMDKASEFAARPSPLPPVVLDPDLSFIDGGHRHLAAKLRGEARLRAFVPVSIHSLLEKRFGVRLAGNTDA